MRFLDIALKDLKEILRDKKSVIFFLAMPLVFTIFMGMALKGPSTPADSRLPMGWINNDSGSIPNNLKESILSSGSIRLVEMGPDQEVEANTQVTGGQLAAALVIPSGFSQDVLAGRNPQMILIVDPVSITGQSVLELVRVPVTRLMSSVEIARMHPENNSQEILARFTLAEQLWKESASSGPRIVIEKAQGAVKKGIDLSANPYNQSSPGMLVMFAIFGLNSAAAIIVQERKNRTLERMITTSLSRAEIVAGHLLAMFALVFVQQVVLILFGQFALHVDYFRQPLGSLLQMIALALWIASLGLLIGVLAKKEEQVVLYSMAGMFIFSALGGAWFPLDGAGKLFTSIGRLTPSAWAMTGFQNILVRGLSSASIWLPFGVQVFYAVLFFTAGVWLFRKQA